MKKFLLSVGVVALESYQTRNFVAAVLMGLMTGCTTLNPVRSFEQQMMFHPRGVDAVPESKAGMESIRIQVTDNEQIHALYFDHPDPRAVVIYCHGNAGNIVDRIPRLSRMRDTYQIAILGFDYRGYGASDGVPSESNMYQDARAARNWLAERRHFNPNEVVVMGRSLGGAVTVELAVNGGAAGLILESTFTRMEDVGGHHFPWLPVSLMVSQEFDSISRIGRFSGPLLQTHGTRDKVVPFELGNRLFEAAKHADKAFVTTSGGHNDLPGRSWELQLDDFFSRSHSEGQAKMSEAVQDEFDCLSQTGSLRGVLSDDRTAGDGTNRRMAASKNR